MTTVLQFIRQRLTRIQIVRFGISLILAILLWGWVTQLQDPLTDTTFSALPITATGLSDSLFLVTTLPDARLTIEGPESRVDDVRAADLALTINLGNIDEPGSYRVRVEVEHPSGVNDDSLEPREVQVQVEEYLTQNFPLEMQSTLPEDDPRQISSMSPSVSEVTVSGPSSAMARVDHVVLPVTISAQTSTFTMLYEPFAVDANDQRINEVTILPAQISTVVELETRGKEVSVIPVVTGNPAEGYSVQQRSAVPDTILVDGPAEILDTLLFVNTSPVNISGATGSISQRVDIANLPEGVTVVDPQDAMVEVRVAIEDTTNTAQVIPALPIEIVDLDPGLAGIADPATVSITIDAPQSVLQSLAASDIRVRASAAGLAPGNHVVELDVSVPEGVTLLQTDQPSVRVTISESAATPESSPASSAPSPATGKTGPPAAVRPDDSVG